MAGVLDATLKTLLDEILLLQLLLPLAGAVLAAGLAMAGPEFAHRAALSNATLTCVLTGVMLGLFGADASVADGPLNFEFRSSRSWTAASPRDARLEPDARNASDLPVLPEVGLQLGIDGVSVWLLALSNWLVFAVLFVLPTGTDQSGSQSCLLLVGQSAAVGCYCCTNLIGFCVFAESLVLGSLLLLSRQSGRERIQAARIFVSMNLLAGIMILIAFSALGLARAAEAAVRQEPVSVSFDLERVAAWAPTLDGGRGFRASLPAWDRMRSVFFDLLVAGFLVKAAIIPFQSWYVRYASAAPPPIQTWFAAVTAPLGWYGLYRFVAPVLPESFSQLAGWLVALGSCGVLAAGVLLVRSAAHDSAQHHPAVFAGVQHSCLALIGLATLTTEGILGAVLISLSQGLSIFVVQFSRPSQLQDTLSLATGAVPPAKRDAAKRDVSPLPQASGRLGRSGRMQLLGRLALAGCPGSVGFAARVLILLGLAGSSVSLPAEHGSALRILIAVVLAGMGLAGLGMLGGGPITPPRKSEPTRPRWSQSLTGRPASLTMLFTHSILLLGLGIFPGLMTKRAAPSIEATLGHLEFVRSAIRMASDPNATAGPDGNPHTSAGNPLFTETPATSTP